MMINFFDLYNLSQNNPKTEEGPFKKWLMIELKSELADELDRWRKENPEALPFKDLFPEPEGKFVKRNAFDNNDWRADRSPPTRVVVPFDADQTAITIVKKLEEIGELNLKNGTISISKENATGQTSQQDIKLGKYILNKKSPFSPKEKEWWNHSGNPVNSLEISAKNKDYAIIISRNPIDIARMSDHDGWVSCHAPPHKYSSPNYFHCALADAKGAGAIAYVVKKADLDGVNLQAPEIFHDKEQSGHSGTIKPISRIRLRKFVNKKEGYDLAVPENRTYGKEVPGFVESLRKWALKSQQEKLKGKRPSMKDFNLVGGSYQDTVGSHLFNHLFGDDKDSGGADYEGEEDNSIFDQYEEEVNAIKKEYENAFTICWFYAEVGGSDGQPYVSYGGSFQLKIPEILMNDDEMPVVTYAHGRDDADYLKYRKIKKTLMEWVRKNHIYGCHDMEIDGNEFRFDLESDGSDPDSFKSFLENDLGEIEKKKKELEAGLYHELINLGLAHENKVHQIAHNWDDHPHQFQNFTWEGEEPEIMVSLAHPIVLGKPLENKSGLQHQYSYWQDQFRKMIALQLKNWADKLFSNQQSQKNLFPGTEFEKQPKRAFSNEFKIVPNIHLNVANSNLIMKMSIGFDAIAPNEEVDEVIDFIGFLDKNYARFQSIVANTYAQWASHWKLPQPQLPDASKLDQQ